MQRYNTVKNVQVQCNKEYISTNMKFKNIQNITLYGLLVSYNLKRK